MARRKQINPMQRIPSGEVMQTAYDFPQNEPRHMNGHIKGSKPKQVKGHMNGHVKPASTPSRPTGGLLQLLICVGGIYASFLTWAYLQERITTTPYATAPDSLHFKEAREYFRFPVFLNTIQSFFAFVCGSIYLFASTGTFRPFSKPAVLLPLLLVSITSTLASPFGYASLAHVDYLTFVLAKSCKLLPVMALHVTVFRKRYPLSKYLVVLAVTAGVAIFTIYHPPKEGSKLKGPIKSSNYGLILLSINLLFDGLTNTVQDHIFESPARYGQMKGPAMMVSVNLLATLLTTAYLILFPLVPTSLLPMMAQGSTNELSSALAFLSRHPAVVYDVLGFAACGAVGQVFIFTALSQFSSLVLTTVTVTRKMLTMMISILWFGKTLTRGQLCGVGLVFCGIGAEAYISHQEKKDKPRKKGLIETDKSR